MKLASWLRAVLPVAIAIAVGSPGCDALGKGGASAEKDDDSGKKKKKSSDDESEEDEEEDEGKKSKKKKKGDEKAATATPADVAPPVTGEAPKPAVPVTSPELQTYPDIPNKIADNCQSAYVVMATAPASVGADYAWTWSRQALLANQQFKVVSGTPSAMGEVSFSTHQASDRFQGAWVLVGQCWDGGTCNKLASMYKAIVKGAQAQPFCGTWPMDLSPTTAKKPVLRDLGNPQNTLPQDTDTIGQCARLQACSVAMDPPNKAGKETIGLDCQKAPSNFKRDCAKKYPCSEVMACLGK